MALSLFAAIALFILLSGSGATSQAAAGDAQLPDLVQVVPENVQLGSSTRTIRNKNGKRVRSKRTLLAFNSFVVNVGQGPLLVDGKRRNTRSDEMKATQLIQHADGTLERVKNKLTWYYAVSKDHQHWHFRDFDKFTLKTPEGKSLKRGNKQGFCIGDRTVGDLTTPGAPQTPVYRDECGLKDKRALAVSGGLSIGWGDDYQAFLEGQSIDITGLKSGIYCLEHRASTKFRELTPTNNLAVALIDINLAAKKVDTDVTLDWRDTPTPSCALAKQIAGG